MPKLRRDEKGERRSLVGKNINFGIILSPSVIDDAFKGLEVVFCLHKSSSKAYSVSMLSSIRWTVLEEWYW